MRLANILGPDLKQVLESDPTELVEALEEFHPEDIAEILDDLPEDQAIALLRALPSEYAADVLERLPSEMQTNVLENMGTEEAATLLTEVDADDAADVIQELEPAVAEKILDQIEAQEPEVAEDLRELVAYPPESAGGRMTTGFVGLPAETKLWQAIEEVRQRSAEGTAETIDPLYVLAYEKLVGVVTLRDLILKDPSQSLGDVMNPNAMSVLPTADQEEVAQTIAKYDFKALPVCDPKGVMLGVVTIDDVMDVVVEEATEDAHKMGAVEPIEAGYFETGYWTFIRKRVIWLVVLFVGGLLTATVMNSYEGEMSAALDLVIFIPLIISSGGNSGSQSSSLIIRSLAVGEIVPKDWLRVVLRELAIGIALGLLLGVVGFARAYLLGSTAWDAGIAASVSLSVIAVVVVGCTVGSGLPLLIKRIGLDPAVSSTPFIASLVDVLGLLVYFSIAKVILGLGAPGG